MTGGTLTAEGVGSAIVSGSGSGVSITGGSITATGSDHGILSNGTLTIGSGITSLVVVGDTSAIYATNDIENSIEGTGWTDTTGSQGQAKIARSVKSKDITEFKKIQFPAVNVSVTNVSLDKEQTTLAVGDTETLTATVEPSDADQTVTWSSDHETVAAVSDSGKITAVAAGTATITATATNGTPDDLNDDITATCTVTVKKNVVAVESITLDKSSLELTEGETATIIATVKPDNATNKTVTWSSSNASVASVDANGTVTAVAEGSATITAKAGDKTATCTVTVKKNGMNAGDPEGFNNENGEW